MEEAKVGRLKLRMGFGAADGLTHNKLTLVPEFREDLANAAVQGIRKSMVRVTESFSDPAT